MSEIERCQQDIEDIRQQLRREHIKMIEDKRMRYDPPQLSGSSDVQGISGSGVRRISFYWSINLAKFKPVIAYDISKKNVVMTV